MTDRSDSRIRGGGKRRKTSGKRRRATTVVAWSAAGLVLLGGSGIGYVYFKLNGNLLGIDINAQLGRDRPANADNGSEDILVLGSDSRSGANAAYGKDGGGARSDTAMIVHVHKGHKTASVVSIPRDTLIDRPECTDSKGAAVPGAQFAMFNTAYEVGGPACAVKTVEKMSGIRMDHYIEVDFTGFKKLVDQLGGVKITTTRAIDDPKSHLKLAPGTHTLDGEQSLGLVRTRHSVGDGSDLGRIELQQAFIKALIEQVKSIGVFSNPKKLYDLADTATRAITPDSQLDSVDKLIGFAGGLKDLGAKDVKMITLPVQYDPADRNRVLPLQAPSQQVWKALREDKPIPASATKDSAGDRGDANGVVESG
ncbi:LCP family protein [Streptomyces scopuliridis]|uniref:LCP family protein n=1 Tax=Streptomyces scopuliridis TaxID=452529 RepID=A0ACD4ZH27_9ACTN|nr:LCP family protein [Streptomyces scopuliridis]WSB33410.1 LCP family protein [Streptomyces scopuliridis]WSB97679.1 LCP family protein [Streptomyces scopuliridis]WSC08618.1 LCP family protein [Streptomyces scopuliridis]